ncbi:extracellular solute-binding protein [Micromonospora sp. NBC_01699]|uniref:extracellular solute-binding protein n=1 Tax=Micromonospora sp. NBC_01699 TaxID=2975984 RepID=UPI002E2A99C5|nr:extracellular solute-binding protein [Micromonospora sp. NBC_01699]
MRRRLVLAGTLAAVLAAGTACGGAADDSAASASVDKLVIYTARDKKVTDYVVEQFTGKFPEYKGKVEVLNLGAQEILERVRAEKANPQADVWWGGTQQGLATGASEDLLAAWQPTFAEKMDAQYRDADGRWFGEILLPEVIMYNNKALTAEQAPKDWDDLLAPQWKDKVIIRDVAASGTMRSIYASMIQRLSKDGSDPQPGYDWLRKLDANTGAYAANPADLYLKLSRQQGTLSAWNLQDILLQADQSNMPFGYVIPASGAPILVDGLAAIKGDNTTGAQKFIEYLFDDKLRADLARDYYQIPAVEIADQPEWLAQLDLKPMDVDWNVIAKNETEWINHWNAQIKNKG